MDHFAFDPSCARYIVVFMEIQVGRQIVDPPVVCTDPNASFPIFVKTFDGIAGQGIVIPLLLCQVGDRLGCQMVDVDAIEGGDPYFIILHRLDTSCVHGLTFLWFDQLLRLSIG